MLFCLFQAADSKGENPDDSRWDYRFAISGVQGQVLGMAFDHKRIYVGGTMQSLGQAVADGVAEVDGRRVKELPDGPQQNPLLLNVTDLKMFQGRLCVGGFFTNVNHQAAGGFAVWHGNKWDSVQITNGIVYALATDSNGGLILAGTIFLPGFTNPVALARWDGKGTWENLNSELFPCSGDVCIDAADQAQALPDGNTVVTLQLSWNIFPSYGYPNEMLARCDASKNWHNMTGPDGDTNGYGFYYLTQFQGQLVAAGTFTNQVNAVIQNIARWDGSAWQPLGGGLEYPVFAVVGNQQVLYAAMQFLGEDGVSRTRVMRWDGAAWTRVGGDDFRSTASGRLYLSPNGDLYYSGVFSGIGSTVAPNLIHWDGSQWQSLFEGRYQGVSGPNPFVWSFAEYAGKVCVGGQFYSAGSVFSQGIAQWDGHGWQSIGGGIKGTAAHRVVALAGSDSELFAGGTFTNMGGVSCSNIARWDGTAWTPLGSGIAGTVSALTIHDGCLIAGGVFTNSSNVLAKNIALWDGTQWQALGMGCDSNVTALTSWQGNLYAGGRFLTAGGNSARGIAKWDGSVWSDVAGGVSGGGSIGRPTSVLAFASSSNALYIGGTFTNAGGVPARNLARWDGTHWQAVGDGCPTTVYALAMRGNSLYVGGKWTNNLGITVHSVRRWDGTNWFDLGSDVGDARGNQQVVALLSTRDSLWVGGRFVWAAGKPSANIARWVECPELEMTRQFDQQNHRGKLTLNIDSGLRGRLETSTDLQHWTPLFGDTNDPSNWQMDEPDQPGQRFFRAVIDP
ncbi:MAG TPA: hypothetical protein VIK53_10300 [Verrucomicrobiae bacterium]